MKELSPEESMSAANEMSADIKGGLIAALHELVKQNRQCHSHWHHICELSGRLLFESHKKSMELLFESMKDSHALTFAEVSRVNTFASSALALNNAVMEIAASPNSQFDDDDIIVDQLINSIRNLQVSTEGVAYATDV